MTDRLTIQELQNIIDAPRRNNDDEMAASLAMQLLTTMQENELLKQISDSQLQTIAAMSKRLHEAKEVMQGEAKYKRMHETMVRLEEQIRREEPKRYRQLTRWQMVSAALRNEASNGH